MYRYINESHATGRMMHFRRPTVISVINDQNKSGLMNNRLSWVRLADGSSLEWHYFYFVVAHIATFGSKNRYDKI